MRSFVFTVVVTGILPLLSAGSSSATDAPVACTLLTQAQIAAATTATVGAGTPISAPTSCQWGGQGKIVTLTFNQQRGDKSPVDQFNAAKSASFPGVTREPIGGVGDDAFYVFYAGTNRAGCGVVVRKGSAVFEVRVYGFELNQAKTVAKTLAQNVAGRI